MLLLALYSTTTRSAEVTMSFGEKIPPYCFPATDSGIELEVIGEALAYRGHVLKPRYYPLARIPLAFIAGEVDAAMTDLGEDLTQAGGHYAEAAVWYDNVFITLKENNIRISTPEDLSGLSVIAFQGAADRYPEWLGAVEAAGNYHEESNQFLQVLTLQRDRFDVVLSDRNIFKYHSGIIQSYALGGMKQIQEHEFTKPDMRDYRPIFRDPQIRDDFNAGLAMLRSKGRIKAIYAKYLNQKPEEQR